MINNKNGFTWVRVDLRAKRATAHKKMRSPDTQRELVNSKPSILTSRFFGVRQWEDKVMLSSTEVSQYNVWLSRSQRNSPHGCMLYIGKNRSCNGGSSVSCIRQRPQCLTETLYTRPNTRSPKKQKSTGLTRSGEKRRDWQLHYQLKHHRRYTYHLLGWMYFSVDRQDPTDEKL